MKRQIQNKKKIDIKTENSEGQNRGNIIKNEDRGGTEKEKEKKSEGKNGQTKERPESNNSKVSTAPNVSDIHENEDRIKDEKTVKLKSQKDLIVIPVNLDRQNKDKTKIKWPKILLNIGKGGIGAGIGGFIISLILHFLLNTGLGWVFSFLLIGLFGVLLRTAGNCLDETVSQSQDIGVEEVIIPQKQNQSLIEQVEKRKEQQNTENKDSNQNEKNSLRAIK